MYRKRRLVSAFCSVALLAALALGRPASASEGVVQSVTGGGHYTVAGELRTFAVGAVKRADGTVSGEYQIVSRVGAGVVIHVSVTCLSVVGNQGWVGGIIDRSDDPAVIEGTVSYFRAIDHNGDNIPDQLSPARINDRAGEDIRFCTERPTLLPLRFIEHGNITVRE